MTLRYTVSSSAECRFSMATTDSAMRLKGGRDRKGGGPSALWITPLSNICQTLDQQHSATAAHSHTTNVSPFNPGAFIHPAAIRPPTINPAPPACNVGSRLYLAPRQPSLPGVAQPPSYPRYQPPIDVASRVSISLLPFGSRPCRPGRMGPCRVTFTI